MLLLATINALLNMISATLSVAGYWQIRKGCVNRHHSLMLGAVAASALFFVSYLAYHSVIGSKPFGGTGVWRIIYFSILLSHTLLAIAVVPLVLVTLRHAFVGNFHSHKTVARWTFPIWVYVSATGVVVYLMLYHWFRP